MKACVIHGARDLRIEERPEPEPGAGEVLVELGAGGICGSDLHYFAEGGVGDFRVREPLVLGHEGAGRIVAIGPGVSGVTPGERVAVNPNRPCGRCRECARGRRNLCGQVRYFGSAARFPHVNGLFADRFVAAANNCVGIPDRLADRAAACAEPLAIALHAASRAGSLEGRPVCVVGAGPIGVLLTAVAGMSGARDVVAIDLFDEPLAIARAMGASDTVNAATEGDRLRAFGTERGRFDVTFEASGHPSGLATALDVTAPGGTVVQVGSLPRGQCPAPLFGLMAKELHLVGTFRFDGEYALAVEVLVSGRIDVAPILTHEFCFSQAIEAFAVAADRRCAMKVTLRPD
jgi:L-idonate 5-dehydrogenase